MENSRHRRAKEQDHGHKGRLPRAIENLRRQHLWGNLSDDDCRRERESLKGQMKLVAKPAQYPALLNLERAARLLDD